MSTGYMKLELVRLMYQNEIIGASPKVELYNGSTLVKTYTSPTCTRTNLTSAARVTCTVEDTSTDTLTFNNIYLKRTAWATGKDTIASFSASTSWNKASDQKLTITITLDLIATNYY